MALETAITVSETANGIGWMWKNLIKPAFTRGYMQRKEMLGMIKEIHKEVKYNSGGTIKDAVARLELGQEKINTRLTELSEQQYSCMNLQNLAFFKSSKDGHWIRVSPAVCQMIGRSEAELMGTNWISWVAKEKERVFRAWEFSQENGSAFDEYVTFRKSDSETATVHILYFPSTELGKLTLKK